MSIPMPAAAMVLAAGFGARMRPLTERTAKPLLSLGGRTLLDHALDRLVAAGVRRVVVNAHWHAEQVAARLRARAALDGPSPQTVLRLEAELLDTAGAVLAALRDGALAEAPFFVVNGDILWLDGPYPALGRLAAAFDPARHDVMLLVSRTAPGLGDVGAGDFAIDPRGTLRRREENEIVPYAYAGLQLVSPALFEGIRHGAFSFNLLWDEAIRRERLAAIVHDGPWFHLSRPADIAEAERALRDPSFGPATT